MLASTLSPNNKAKLSGLFPSTDCPSTPSTPAPSRSSWPHASPGASLHTPSARATAGLNAQHTVSRRLIDGLNEASRHLAYVPLAETMSLAGAHLCMAEELRSVATLLESNSDAESAAQQLLRLAHEQQREACFRQRHGHNDVGECNAAATAARRASQLKQCSLSILDCAGSHLYDGPQHLVASVRLLADREATTAERLARGTQWQVTQSRGALLDGGRLNHAARPCASTFVARSAAGSVRQRLGRAIAELDQVAEREQLTCGTGPAPAGHDLSRALMGPKRLIGSRSSRRLRHPSDPGRHSVNPSLNLPTDPIFWDDGARWRFDGFDSDSDSESPWDRAERTPMRLPASRSPRPWYPSGPAQPSTLPQQLGKGPRAETG